MAENIVKDIASAGVDLGIKAVAGFGILLGITVGAIVLKFGAQTILDIVQSGIGVIQSIV